MSHKGLATVHIYGMDRSGTHHYCQPEGLDEFFS